MAAPTPLDELLKDSAKMWKATSRAICVAHDVDRVALLIKHAPAGRHFRDLIYGAHLEVVWVRETKNKPELVARVDRIMEIVLERFEEIKGGGFDGGLLASICRMRERCAEAVAEKARDVKICDVGVWCDGKIDGDKAFVCDECGDATCVDCFQEIGYGFICEICEQKYCDPCCDTPKIRALIDETTCKKCEKIPEPPLSEIAAPAARRVAALVAHERFVAAKKKKVDPIA